MKIKTPVLTQSGHWWSDRHGRDWLCVSSAMAVLDVVDGEVFKLIISTKQLKGDNVTKLKLIVDDYEVFIRHFDEDYELNDLPQTVLLNKLPKRFTKACNKGKLEHCDIWVKVKSYGVPHTYKDEQRILSMQAIENAAIEVKSIIEGAIKTLAQHEERLKA
jgi:hypothetical protein